jgi:hypothetical protein
MPLSAYRNWVGVAKVTTASYLTASAAVGATSLVVASATGITTSSSVIILDGPNTEVRAVTGVTTNTLTVAATTYAHSENVYVFAQPTASVGPTSYIPMKTFTVPDKIAQIYDETYRGSMVSAYSVAAALRESEWSFGGDMFADTFGWVARGFFGTEDFTSGTPNIHNIGLQNTGSNALGEYGQPDYYAYYVFNALNTRVVVGKVTELGIKFDPKAAVTYTAKLMARASGVVTTPTVSFSSVVPIPSWRASLTWNSVGYRTPMTADYTFTRKSSEAIPTMQGIQDPYTIFVGEVEAKAKFAFVKEDDTIYNLFAAGTQFPVSMAMTQGSGSSQIGLTVQTSVCNSDTDENKLQGKAYNTEDVDFTCLGNSTDATTAGGGEANAKLILSNNIANNVY